VAGSIFTSANWLKTSRAAKRRGQVPSANGQILTEDAKKLKRGFLHSIAEPMVL
jgi:hypothetical protein